MKVAVVLVVLAIAINIAYGCTLGTISGCDSSGSTAGITAQIVAQLNSMGYSFRGMDGNRVHCPGWTCVLQNSAAGMFFLLYLISPLRLPAH